MRPLMVRTEKGSGPLFCSGLPVSGCFGGGGSRLPGPGAELDGGLVGGLAEAGQEIADLLLAGVDDPAGWGLVDGIGHPPAELLELGAELLDEGLGGDLRWIIHGWFLGVGSAEANASPGPSAVHRLRYALPEDLPRPQIVLGPFLVDGTHGRQIIAARAAPLGPEVEDDALAGQVGPV